MRKKMLAIVFLLAAGIMGSRLAERAFATKPRTKIIEIPQPPKKPAKPPAKSTPPKSAPQKSPSKPRKVTGVVLEKAPVLNLYYKVTIKGSGQMTETDGYATTTTIWSVDRQYDGVAKLDVRSSTPVPPNIKPGMSVQQMQAVLKTMNASGPQLIQWSSAFSPKNQFRSVNVKIKDRKKTVVDDPPHGEYAGVSSTTTQAWDCDTTLKTYNIATAEMNGKDKTFNLTLAFDTLEDSQHLLHTQTVKSSPEKPDDGTKTTKLEVSSVKFPSVKGLLALWTIHHAPPRRISGSTGDTLQFDSDELTPDKPIFPDVPESKSKVKIVVHYKATSW